MFCLTPLALFIHCVTSAREIFDHRVNKNKNLITEPKNFFNASNEILLPDRKYLNVKKSLVMERNFKEKLPKQFASIELNAFNIIAADFSKEPVRVKRGFESNKNEWSKFSCCRRQIGIQTREKIVNERIVRLETRECSWDYCTECFDKVDICVILRDLQNACESDSDYFGFMSRQCPQTCYWCVINETTTSPLPANSNFIANLRQVKVYYNNLNPFYNYQFAIASIEPEPSWKSVAKSIREGEVESFYLYTKPTGNFTMRITFCTAGTKNSQKWIVTKDKCGGFWKEKLVLYGINVTHSQTEKLFVANRGRTPWTSRIYRESPCCGYRSSIWSFYAPTFRALKPASNSTLKSRTPDQLLSTTTTSRPTIKPVAPDNISPAEQECLDYHNYFRSFHKVPPLQLDARLVMTAKKWADVLAENAPTHPFITKPNFNQSANWPHSDRGTIFRDKGVGENIAWDLSPEGSPLRQSVLKWYAEVFDFDEMNPMRSYNGKPVGHYTQLLWKSSTLMGCAVSVKNVLRGSYSYQSTYTVAHYAPSGNIHLSNAEEAKAIYAANVLSLDEGSCMSPRSCSVYKNQRSRCLGMSKRMTCKCATSDAGVFGGRPRCFGSGGCIVVCKEPPHAEYTGYNLWERECQGEWSCECIHYPKAGKAGAICT